MDRLNDKLVILKKLSVVAAILCLPLWMLTYSLLWNGLTTMTGLGVGGVPLALALLIAGYCVKQRRVATALCVSGLVMSLTIAATSASALITANSGLF